VLDAKTYRLILAALWLSICSAIVSIGGVWITSSNTRQRDIEAQQRVEALTALKTSTDALKLAVDAQAREAKTRLEALKDLAAAIREWKGAALRYQAR